MRRLLILVACLAAAALLAAGQARPPRPAPADAPAPSFSAARAMADVRLIARVPHPVGSPANAQVRDHLLRRMAELGLQPRVARADALGWRGAGGRTLVFGGRVENLVGVLPGRDRTAPALAIIAHYDSVPNSPGAADDAAGVAAGLEIVRALKSRGEPLRDVVLLFTDGEEAGLLGAKAFFRADPLARRIGFVLNLEARGGGGRALMFETGPRPSQAVGLFRRSAQRPQANSAAAFVYALMPNDTDFSEARAAGVPGLNYAFLGRQFDYHSASSTPDNLDQGALQDIGVQVLAAAAAAAFAPNLPEPDDEVVYAQVFGDRMIAYPPAAGWAVLAAAAALLALGMWRARRIGPLSWADLWRGVAAAAYVLLASAALLRLARAATGVGQGLIEQRALTAQAGRFETALVLIGLGAILFAAAAAHGRRRLVAAGVALAAGAGGFALGGGDLVGLGLGAAAAVTALAAFGAPSGVAGSWAGLAVAVLVAAVAIQAAAPAVAFLAAWPLAVAANAAAFSGFSLAKARASQAALAAFATLGLAWLGGVLHGVYLGLDLPELLAPVCLLAALVVWPFAHALSGRAAGGLALALLAAGLGLAAQIRLADPWSPRHPQTGFVLYQLDQDARRAWRVSLRATAGSDWSRAVLGADGGETGAHPATPLAAGPVVAAPARWVEAPAPRIAQRRAAGGRVAVHIVPPAGSRVLALTLETRAEVADVRINGMPAPLLRRPGEPGRLRWEAPARGVAISFRPQGSGELRLRYEAAIPSWPVEALPLPPRPAEVMAFDLSDSTLVTGTRRIAW